MQVCQTSRLTIRHLVEQDAEFVIELLNDKSFIDNVGDKKVKNIEDAVNYIQNGPIASYNEFGFGLNLIVLKDSDIPIGICGLVTREELEHSDLGYALLPKYWSNGYAHEASLAVMKDGHENHGLKLILAFTSPTNDASNGLLKKLGFSFKGEFDMSGHTDNLYEYCFS